MKSYLLSSLAHQYRDLPLALFEERVASAWLVWEPGAWSVPRERGQTTIVADSGNEAPSAGGEALAIELAGSEPGPLQRTFGRGDTCDLVINDATLSSLHLVFMRSEGRLWTVRDAGSTNGSWLDGQALIQGRPVTMAPGALLKAGRVHLSFYDAAGLHGRLALETLRKAQRGLGPKPSTVQSA
jgi:hypothetical protein